MVSISKVEIFGPQKGKRGNTGVNTNEFCPSFAIGDLVKYSWQKEGCGIVLDIGSPQHEREGREYLYVLWTTTEASQIRWWVPIDRWIIKC